MLLSKEHIWADEVGEEVKGFLIRKKLVDDPQVLKEAWYFVLRVFATKKAFKSWENEDAGNITQKREFLEFQSSVKKLTNLVDNDVKNIASITITGTKGRGFVTFPINFFSQPLVDKLFHDYGPKPQEDLNEDRYAQLEYALRKPKLVMPVKLYRSIDRRKLFKAIVEDSVALGKAFYAVQKRKNKTDVQKLIKTLLLRFHADVCTKGDHAEDRYFKKYLFPLLQ